MANEERLFNENDQPDEQNPDLMGDDLPDEERERLQQTLSDSDAPEGEDRKSDDLDYIGRDEDEDIEEDLRNMM